MLFNQTFKNLRRTREIIQVLVKYGFEDLITNSTLRNLVSERRRLTWMRQERPVFEYTRWERIRMVAEELGPTFIKLAQVLSNRPDMLPEPLIKEFEKLQDKVPPFPFAQAKRMIESESGKRLEDIFIEFDEVVLASASIGQVYKARLKTGEQVVVKVQRPGVKDTVEQDLAILKEGVRRADRYLKQQGILNAEDIVRAFERSMSKELDYGNEARNIDRFRAAYKNMRTLYISESTTIIRVRRVMVIEFADACKVTDVAQLKAWGLDPLKIVENGMEIYLTMIFEHGFFHADPHPGNVLVRRDGVICLIDFGMVGQLMRQDKYAFAGVFIAMARQDPNAMAVQMRRLAIEDDITDMRAFVYDLNELVEDYASLDVSEGSIADMTAALQKIMFQYQMKVPAGIFLIFRAFAILEGIGKTMHPNFNTYEFIRPDGARVLKSRLSPENMFSDFTYRIDQLTGFLNTLPTDIRHIDAEGPKRHTAF